MKVQPIYTNKFLKKGLEFAAGKGALFTTTASLVLSTAARPLAILAAPDTDRENKKYACVKSIASSFTGFLLMLAASNPVSRAVKNIDKEPLKYLKKRTIDNLKAPNTTLKNSGKYTFATQLFTLGLGFFMAVPKSTLTCALIPPLMTKVFPDREKKEKLSDNKNISFAGSYKSGTDKLAKFFGKIINTKAVQNLADKFHDKHYEMHIISLTDILATGTFINQTSKSKKIKEERKKALMYNAGISTALCIGGSYALNNLSKNSTEKFIKKFTEANINDPKLATYIEGIRIAKPALIMGGIYYIIIPLISTFLADRFDPNSSGKRH